MRTACGFVVAILLPAAALAQSRPFAVWERSAAGVVIGPSANGDYASDHDYAADIDFVFETPVVFGYRLRADASRVGWQFDPHHPGVGETVTVKSVRVGLVRVYHAGPHLTKYIGGGYGEYRYEFERRPARHPLRRGLHVLGGLEITSQNQRYAYIAEIRLHGIGSPGLEPVTAYTLIKSDFSIGMKVRF